MLKTHEKLDMVIRWLYHTTKNLLKTDEAIRCYHIYQQKELADEELRSTLRAANDRIRAGLYAQLYEVAKRYVRIYDEELRHE